MAATDKRLSSLVEQFCSVTGSQVEVANQMLEACNNNLEMAINTFMEGNMMTSQSTAESSGMSGDESVREPIPQTSEQMVTEHQAFGFKRKRYKTRSVFDGFRDFAAEASAQVAAPSNESRRLVGKAKTLEDLFRPPIDIIFKGTFAAARTHAVNQSLWLMVNIQDTAEFECQKLNRDVWSNAAVRNILHEHFLLYQVYKESEEGEKYMQFYKVLEWPYVAIIDPRTGEKMQTWSRLDALTFCDHATTFLTAHPSLNHSSTNLNDIDPQEQTQLRDGILNATEEDQIKAAISASLTAVTSPETEPVLPPQKLNPLRLTDTDSEMSDLETFTDSEDDNLLPPPSKKRKSDTSDTDSSGSRRILRSSKIEKTKDKTQLQSLYSDVSMRGGTKLNAKRSAKSPDGKKSLNSKKSPNCKKSPNRKMDISPSLPNGTLDNNSDKNVPLKKRTNLQSGNVNDGTSKMITDTMNGDVKAGENKEKKDSWKRFLGNEADAKSCLMLRYPDGSREQFSIPCSSKVLAVVHYLSDKGYPSNQYELVTIFPRRKISPEDLDLTLKAARLYPQETIFVQTVTQ